jgi:hypothetical protein
MGNCCAIFHLIGRGLPLWPKSSHLQRHIDLLDLAVESKEGAIENRRDRRS